MEQITITTEQRDKIYHLIIAYGVARKEDDYKLSTDLITEIDDLLYPTKLKNPAMQEKEIKEQITEIENKIKILDENNKTSEVRKEINTLLDLFMQEETITKKPRKWTDYEKYLHNKYLIS
jgi:hypothetical protein